MKKLNCLRCGGDMKFGLRQHFQMGKAGFFSGDWPHLLAGALELDVYFCPDCGKVEFFTPDSPQTAPEMEEFDFVASMVNQDIDAVSADGMPQKKCPVCGRNHDFDYPKCPHCGHDCYAK